MHLFGKWAGFSFGIAGLSGLVTLIMKFVDGLSMNRNPLLTLTAFLLFSGFQFLAMGLLAELMTRVYHEAQDKAIYSVRKRLNFTAEED